MKLISESTHTILSAGHRCLKLLLQAALLLFVLLSLLLKFGQRALLLQCNAHHMSAWLLSNNSCYCMGNQLAPHVGIRAGASRVRPTWTAASLGNALQNKMVCLLKVLMQCQPTTRNSEAGNLYWLVMQLDCATGHPHAAFVQGLTRRSWRYQSCLGAPCRHLPGSAASVPFSCRVHVS